MKHENSRALANRHASRHCNENGRKCHKAGKVDLLLKSRGLKGVGCFQLPTTDEIEWFANLANNKH